MKDGIPALSFFAPEAFTHQNTDFKLQGVHRELDCDDCHNPERLKPELQPTGESIKYRHAANNCFDCHRDDEPHQGSFGRDCVTCHQPGGWDELSIDHGLTPFPLIGSHTEVPCASCHTQAPDSKKARRCRDCHLSDDAHNQQLSLNCARCHNPNGWNHWQFNHNRQTTFLLSGTHQEIECIACHSTPVEDKFQLSTACVDCHWKDYPHRREFSLDCGRCHRPTSFKNVKLSN
jgi:hypothetical protein